MSGRLSGWREMAARMVGVLLLIAMVAGIARIADAQNNTRQPGGRVLLPSQNGNSGKVLTTDGSQLSWGVALPSQSGANGLFLTSNGSTASWAATTIGPASMWLDPVNIPGTTSAGCQGFNAASGVAIPYDTFLDTPSTAPNQPTWGNGFTIYASSFTIRGGTFKTEDVGLDHVVALWGAGGVAGNNTAKATCTVLAATVTAAGQYSCTFSSPVAGTQGNTYIISVHTADQHRTSISNCSVGGVITNPPLIGQNNSVWGGPNLLWQEPIWGQASGAMTKPTLALSSSAPFPVRPDWTVP